MRKECDKECIRKIFGKIDTFYGTVCIRYLDKLNMAMVVWFSLKPIPGND